MEMLVVQYYLKQDPKSEQGEDLAEGLAEGQIWDEATFSYDWIVFLLAEWKPLCLLELC